jgi:ribosomal protein L7/L12
MTTLPAALDFNNLVIGAAIGAVIGFFSVGTGRGAAAVNVKRLALQVSDLQKKLDALLKHQGIEMPTPSPSDLSPELQLMAKDSHQKIAAIKRYREENPGTGLFEAKQRIEEFSKTGR